MKVHWRFDSYDGQHSKVTLFVNGGNAGHLTLSAAESLWLHFVLAKGCQSLSPPGMKPIEFVASGKPPGDENDVLPPVP